MISALEAERLGRGVLAVHSALIMRNLTPHCPKAICLKIPLIKQKTSKTAIHLIFVRNAAIKLLA